MTPSPDSPPPDEAWQQPGQLIAAARDWSDGKTAKEMAQELYVRWLQIAAALMRVCSYHGEDLDGEPIQGAPPHPMPTPAELRVWLAQLLPPGSGGPPTTGGMM